MRFYLEGRNVINKKGLFDAKFFEFEEFSQAPFFWVASSLSILCRVWLTSKNMKAWLPHCGYPILTANLPNPTCQVNFSRRFPIKI